MLIAYKHVNSALHIEEVGTKVHLLIARKLWLGLIAVLISIMFRGTAQLIFNLINLIRNLVDIIKMI